MQILFNDYYVTSCKCTTIPQFHQTNFAVKRRVEKTVKKILNFIRENP